MLTPETFEDELVRRCGRTYRLRRAVRNGAWLVEQKVRPGLDYPGHTDQIIRVRDGYRLVLDLGLRDWQPCPTCHLRLDLPVGERAEVECGYCHLRGERTRVISGYFPLSEATLQYLERWHPRRGAEINAEIDRINAGVARDARAYRLNTAEALAADHWRQVAGIPMVGYTKAGSPHAYGA